MRLFISLILATFALSAQMVDFMSGEPKIVIQNKILAKVNDNTISMMDVKKRMDLLFHQHYPQMIESTQARYQFYEASWRRILSEMIDNELILADAAEKEVKLTDAEVREEIENRFGPSVMPTLDKIGVTYEEAWKMIKNEMIVARMTWWFVQSKAMVRVTPQDIRQNYHLYLKENPSRTEWKYHVLTISDKQMPLAEELFQKIQLAHSTYDTLPEVLKTFQAEHPEFTVALSNQYSVVDTELSDTHRTSLASLIPGSFSAPALQSSKDKKKVIRIFYLADKLERPTPTFEELAPQIKNELLQKSSIELSENYLTKLRKHYRFDSTHLKEVLPEDLHPFALQ